MLATIDKPKVELKSVVYATDLSIDSQNAGFYAARLAAYFSAKLLVAHAFTLSQAATEVELIHSRLSQQRLNLKSRLSMMSSLLASDTVEAIPTLLEGDPVDVLPELADLHAPSLIVLGTHGGGWLGRYIIGSVAEQTIWSTRCPLFIVGPLVPPFSWANFPFQRVLYAADFSAAAAHSAEFAFSIAEALGAEFDVLNVIEKDATSDPDRLADLENRFFGALAGRVSSQVKDVCDPKTYVTLGRAHDRILEQIRERSIDLLVLGIRKTSQLGMKMKTSRAFQLIVDAECPVLTIRM